MPIRKANAIWKGNLREGEGLMKLASGAYEGRYSFSTRFEDEPGTNPEELIAAAHAGCFSMALSSGLGRAGFTPESVETTAEVTLDKVDGKNQIIKIHLITLAKVPGVSNDQFQEIAATTKSACPVSVALSAVPISLEAKLIS
jgi:osmotically inducible protein OsmC